MTSDQREHATAAAEFDAYAPGYAGGIDNPVKAVLGETADAFIDVKVDWLLRHMPALAHRDMPMRILDYGCGAGALLRRLAVRGLSLDMTGSDVSVAMLAEARATWPAALGAPPRFLTQSGTQVPAEDACFDLAIISAVFHHVVPAERASVAGELFRLVRPGGSVVVFEHNPWNPVTRYVVARTPIDANAILLPATETRALLSEAGLAQPSTSYLMFGPPRLGLFRMLDRGLGWLPLGAQYAVSATRPGSA